MKIKISKLSLFAITWVFLSQVGVAKENSGEELAIKNHCYACHHQTQPLIGPPYQAIAARHGANKKVMADVLAEKIILGGGGNWGVVPMVPNEQVNEQEAKVMAEWILGLNGKK